MQQIILAYIIGSIVITNHMYIMFNNPIMVTSQTIISKYRDLYSISTPSLWQEAVSHTSCPGHCLRYSFVEGR